MMGCDAMMIEWDRMRCDEIVIHSIDLITLYCNLAQCCCCTVDREAWTEGQGKGYDMIWCNMIWCDMIWYDMIWIVGTTDTDSNTVNTDTVRIWWTVTFEERWFMKSNDLQVKVQDSSYMCICLIWWYDMIWFVSKSYGIGIEMRKSREFEIGIEISDSI